MTSRTLVRYDITLTKSLMNFALRCVRIFPGVNSRAELVTLA